MFLLHHFEGVRVLSIVAVSLFVCWQIHPNSADDTFTCCMAGWKSVRGVVTCPRPCCSGYSLRSAYVAALGPVTYCSKEGATTSDAVRPQSVSVEAAPASPVSHFNPLATPFALNNPTRQGDQQSPDKAQLRLRRVYADDGSQPRDRFPRFRNERLLCQTGLVPDVASE